MREWGGLLLELHALSVLGRAGGVLELVFLNGVACRFNKACELVVSVATVGGVALCLNVVEDSINPIMVFLTGGKVLDHFFLLQEDAVELIVLSLGGCVVRVFVHGNEQLLHAGGVGVEVAVGIVEELLGVFNAAGAVLGEHLHDDGIHRGNVLGFGFVVFIAGAAQFFDVADDIVLLPGAEEVAVLLPVLLSSFPEDCKPTVLLLKSVVSDNHS